MVVSSEHNTNLVWSKATDGKNYTSGSGTDTNRWAPRGYGPNDLLEGYGASRQGTGDTNRWEFAAVDLGEITVIEDLVLYHSELASSYRVWLWDGQNPVNPDSTPFEGEINGSYTPQSDDKLQYGNRPL